MSSTSFDQASGLRELFGSMQGLTSMTEAPQAQVLALVCPSRPALTLPLAQLCSRQLRQLQMRHAWIDELDFNLREDWPLPCPVRFDLGQSLSNHVPLGSAMQSLDDRRSWYASARRLSSVDKRSMPLTQRLADSGLDFDWVVVSASPEGARSWSLYGPHIRPLIVCEASAQGTALALEWVHREMGKKDGLDLHRTAWLLLGAPDESAQQARTAIERGCKALLEKPPVWMDHADAPADAALSPLLDPWQAPATRLIEWLCLH